MLECYIWCYIFKPLKFKGLKNQVEEAQVGGSGSRLGDENNMENLKVMKKEVHNLWVTVTKAWRVLRLRMEERLPI